MGQHRQEQSEGRQAEEWGGRLGWGGQGRGCVCAYHHRLAQRPQQHHRDI